MPPGNDANWAPAGSDGTYQYSTAALSVFWPEAEYAKLAARWPHLTAHVGATWDEHRHQVERHCALVDRDGHAVNQLRGDFGDLEEFLTGIGITSPTADDLRAYPDLQTATTAMASWPPARTAPCWCGSGHKYKRCCRPHGLGTLD
jgi:hypothetical protein